MIFLNSFLKWSQYFHCWKGVKPCCPVPGTQQTPVCYSQFTTIKIVPNTIICVRDQEVKTAELKKKTETWGILGLTTTGWISPIRKSKMLQNLKLEALTWQSKEMFIGALPISDVQIWDVQPITMSCEYLKIWNTAGSQAFQVIGQKTLSKFGTQMHYEHTLNVC